MFQSVEACGRQRQQSLGGRATVLEPRLREHGRDPGASPAVLDPLVNSDGAGKQKKAKGDRAKRDQGDNGERENTAR